MERKIIAIDGYSSCGKSTFAKLIAKELGYLFVDTGAMYRAVTLFALREKYIGGAISDDDLLLANLHKVDITFKLNSETSENVLYLNQEPLIAELRTLEISNHVSHISSIPEVRERLLLLQQSYGKYGNVVMDGRDVGTKVFPNASIKIFMTASAEIRAQRRYLELKANGQEAPVEDIYRNIIERDTADTTRKVSPLIQAEDAIILDNSNLTLADQLKWFKETFKSKLY